MTYLLLSAYSKQLHRAGDIGNVPLTALDSALSAMSEEELRMLEYKTEIRSKVDLIADTWPLWYSIYVRYAAHRPSTSLQTLLHGRSSD